MFKKFVFIWMMVFAPLAIIAQGDTQLWLTYNNQTRLSDKWGYTFDLNYRTRGFFPFNSTLTAARVGANYFVHDRLRVTAGYAWFGTYVTNFNINWLPEHRLWQQIMWTVPKSKFQVMHRFRLEQRFRQELVTKPSTEPTYAYTTRARYMIQFQGLIIPPKEINGFQLGWQAANEIMIHSGDNLGNHIFNQNRTLAGVVISPNRKLDFAVLYQLILQYQPVLDKVEEVNSIRLTAFHNLDYRKRR
jgi:hypothetical protein